MYVSAVRQMRELSARGVLMLLAVLEAIDGPGVAARRLLQQLGMQLSIAGQGRAGLTANKVEDGLHEVQRFPAGKHTDVIGLITTSLSKMQELAILEDTLTHAALWGNRIHHIFRLLVQMYQTHLQH
jgi:hypothetical protein